MLKPVLGETERMAPSTPGLLSDALQWFRCPVCHGTLELKDQNITCTRCARGYAVHDGIPVLLGSREIAPEQNS